MSEPSKRPVKPQQLNLGLSMDKGPNGGGLISKVEKWGAGLKAGVAVGDEVMAWNGQRPKSFEEFVALLDSIGVGNVVKVTVLRAGKQIELNLTIPKRKVLSLDLDEIDEVLERKISP